MEYERRHGYRGPEGYVDLPANANEADDASNRSAADHFDSDDLVAAVVLDASPSKVSG